MRDLSFRIEIALGMVTNNVETDLDITNGARGEIVDIILHQDEQAVNTNSSIIQLKYLLRTSS